MFGESKIFEIKEGLSIVNKKQNDNEATKANLEMDRIFNGDEAGQDKEASITNSEADQANREVDQEFYEEKAANETQPYHIESNSPPIKK